MDFVDDSEVVYVAGHSVVRLDIENGPWRCVLVRASACLRRTDSVCGWGAGGGGGGGCEWIAWQLSLAKAQFLIVRIELPQLLALIVRIELPQMLALAWMT